MGYAPINGGPNVARKSAKAGRIRPGRAARACRGKRGEREPAHAPCPVRQSGTGAGGCLDDRPVGSHIVSMDQIYLIITVVGFLGLSALAYSLRPECPQDRPDERPLRRK